MLPLVKDALVVQSSTAWTPGLCSCLTLAHFPVYKSSSVRLRVKGQNALYLSWFTQRQSLAPTPSTHPSSFSSAVSNVGEACKAEYDLSTTEDSNTKVNDGA